MVLKASTRLPGLLALATLLVLGLAFLSGMRSSRLALESESLNLNLRYMSRLQNALHGAEAAQRGYLLTNERRYLAPFATAEQDLRRRLDFFRDRLPSGAWNELDRLSALKFREMREAIDLQDARRPEAARARVLRDDDLRLTASLDELIERPRADWRQRLERLQAEHARLRTRQGLAYGGALGLIVLTAFGFWHARQQRRQRKRLEAQRLAHETAERRLRLLIQEMPIGCTLTDAGHRIQAWNPACEQLFGDREAEVLGRPILDVLRPAGDPDAHARGQGAMMDEGGSGRVQGHEARFQNREGRQIVVQCHATRIHDSAQLLIGHLALWVDIGAQLQQQAQLQALSQQLLTVQAEERKHLAHVLHDQLGQSLVAVQIRLEALEIQMGHHEDVAETARWRAALSEVNRELAENLSDVRSLLIELRPPMLEEFGLLAALESELGSMRKQFPGAVFQMAAPRRDCPRWTPAQEQAAFSILREALRNAARHAGASRIQVEAAEEIGCCRFTVRDDGRGFEPDDARCEPGHLGLVGMREQAAAIGAHLEIRSAPGEGTAVTVSLPHGFPGDSAAGRPEDHGPPR